MNKVSDRACPRMGDRTCLTRQKNAIFHFLQKKSGLLRHHNAQHDSPGICDYLKQYQNILSVNSHKTIFCSLYKFRISIAELTFLVFTNLVIGTSIIWWYQTMPSKDKNILQSNKVPTVDSFQEIPTDGICPMTERAPFFPTPSADNDAKWKGCVWCLKLIIRGHAKCDTTHW